MYNLFLISVFVDNIFNNRANQLRCSACKNTWEFQDVIFGAQIFVELVPPVNKNQEYSELNIPLIQLPKIIFFTSQKYYLRSAISFIPPPKTNKGDYRLIGHYVTYSWREYLWEKYNDLPGTCRTVRKPSEPVNIQYLVYTK